MMVGLVAIYQVLQEFNIFSFGASAEGSLGLGTIFLIGLTASFSTCLAMVGGLLLSVSAKWADIRPKSAGIRKLTPLLHFNAGRLLGYFVFGGLTGLLGELLILSIQTTGLITIVLSVAMIVLGLNILGLLPKRFCRIPLPPFLLQRIRRMSTGSGASTPFLLGAATYFVPCGFTQSMQLFALSSGSFLTGATVMLVFALGTLPALLGISALSSFAEGRSGKLFFTFAGTASFLLGAMNLQSGLLLTGIDVTRYLPSYELQVQAYDPNVTIDRNGQQIISVEVTDRGYSSASFTIDPDRPTWIYANAPETLSGCISNMSIPTYGMSSQISKGENWLGPIQPTKDFAFMCNMGMFKADVHVRS